VLNNLHETLALNSILEKIVVNKRFEIEELKIEWPLQSLKERFPDRPKGLFRKAIENRSGVNIIAEIKKSSPSKGILLEDFDPVSLAKQYRDGGAAALSVLTERKYFFGRAENLGLARQESGLPVLCKDFIVDPIQLHYARAMSADAVLLIVRLLTSDSLRDYIRMADEIGLDCLVEVHDENELEIALDAGAGIIGVNNRNLEDFSVTLETSERLASMMPKDIIRIAESGIFNADDIVRLRKAAYNNFLIGEALVKAKDPAALIRSLRNG